MQKKIQKIISIVLVFSFIFPVFSFAQEVPENTGQDNIIPVYFFLHHTSDTALGILAITPFDDDVFLWVYAPLLSTIKNIFAGDRLLATIENSLATSSAGSVSTSTPALDSTSTSITTGFVVGPVTKTWTHTVTGTDPLIVLSADIFQDVGGIGTITSASWNGGTFTKASSTRTGTKSTEMWYLVATTTGAKTMSVTITGDTDAIKMAASSFTGIARTSPLDVKASSNGSSGNPSVSLTTLNQSDVIVTTINRHSTTDATTTQASLYKDRVTSTLGASSYILGTTTKLYTDTYVGSASQNWSMIMGAFKPATSTSGGSVATASTTVRYIHSDHLGSPTVITNASSTIAETIDYYPYGANKFDNNTTSSNSQRKYIDQVYDADTSLSYLNARYYNGAQGQFTSLDPVFLGPAEKQNLKDPQSLNSYGYANGNPVMKSDPTGRCVGPLVAVCGAALFGAVGGVGFQAFDDYLTGEFSERTWQENLGTYAIVAGQGALVGAATGGAGVVAKLAQFSKIATVATVGGTTGASTIATTYGGNYALGRPTDLTDTLISGGVSAVTAGALRTLPQVVGRNSNFNTRSFYTGVHTQRQAAEEFLINSVNTFSRTVNRFAQQNYSAGGGTSSGGGSNLSGLVQQLQSLVGSLKGLVSSLSNSKNTQ